MALTKAQKDTKVAMLAKELEGSTTAIVGTFTGLTAAKDFALRKTVRDAGGSYHVVKNKLAARSSRGTKVEQALQGLKGVSAVAYTAGDPVTLAKALSTWVKDNAEFTFKLAIVDGKVIDTAGIDALATLPGKEELFSKLLFLINAPATRLATVMNAVGRNLAVVVNQAVEQNKFAAAGSPAAEPTATQQPEAAAPAPEAPAAGEATATSAAPAETPAAPAAAAPETPAPEPTPEQQIAANPAAEADAVAETPAEQPSADSSVEAAHATEAAAGEQPSGAAQPENGTASQAGEAAGEAPAEG